MSGRVLLPIRKYLQEGNFCIDLISVWMVVTAHADKTGRAFPSIERVAGLAGVRKASALTAIKTLERQDIIIVHHDDGKHTYIVPRYHTGDTGNARNWISLPASLIMSGSWVLFPKSAKISYLYLSALSWPGRAVDGDWQVWEKADYPFDFLPENRIPLQIPGLSDRSSRRARAWLASHEFVEVYQGDICDGLAIPHDPPVLAGAANILKKLAVRMENKQKTRTLAALVVASARNEVGLVQ